MYGKEEKAAIRRGLTAAVVAVVNADGSGTLRESNAFTKALQKALPKHLWKIYLGDLKVLLIDPSEYLAAIQTAFVILDQADPADGYVTRFALIHALQQGASHKDGITPPEQAAINHIMQIVGAPNPAAAPPGYTPPPIY